LIRETLTKASDKLKFAEHYLWASLCDINAPEKISREVFPLSQGVTTAKRMTPPVYFGAISAPIILKRLRGRFLLFTLHIVTTFNLRAITAEL
jgi:hypothetical protein